MLPRTNGVTQLTEEMTAEATRIVRFASPMPSKRAPDVPRHERNGEASDQHAVERQRDDDHQLRLQFRAGQKRGRTVRRKSKERDARPPKEDETELNVSGKHPGEEHVVRFDGRPCHEAEQPEIRIKVPPSPKQTPSKWAISSSVFTSIVGLRVCSPRSDGAFANT